MPNSPVSNDSISEEQLALWRAQYSFHTRGRYFPTLRWRNNLPESDIEFMMALINGFPRLLDEVEFLTNSAVMLAKYARPYFIKRGEEDPSHDTDELIRLCKSILG